ncbi:hypothetical protein BJ741DRAFT_646488 [Chytriomyces cf. hyalinus JEL632]|nr:hypothetical protein BJ741DRAFT_646488 [Chytriomyces cf. hyalinus JEL632]
MKLLSLTLAATSLATYALALAEPGFQGLAYDPESVTNFFNRVSGPNGELIAPKGFGQGCTNATVGTCAEGLSCVLNSPAPDESVMVDLEAGICMKAQGEGEECGGDTVFAAVCKAPLLMQDVVLAAAQTSLLWNACYPFDETQKSLRQQSNPQSPFLPVLHYSSLFANQFGNAKQTN